MKMDKWIEFFSHPEKIKEEDLTELEALPLVTDAEDKLVAVGISMPSLSEALQKAKGRLLWNNL